MLRYRKVFLSCEFYISIRFLVGKSKNNRVTDKESRDFTFFCINLNDCLHCKNAIYAESDIC